MTLPIEPYLIELVQRMQQHGIPLTVAGGLGIYLKHRWVLERLEAGQHKPLLMDIPDARATDDIDAFFGLEVYLQPTRTDFREILRELGYRPIVDYLIFEKPVPDEPARKLGLDLLSPLRNDERLKVDKPTAPGKLRRMGPTDNRSSPPEQRLHAFATPEAFAIDELPQTLPLLGLTPHGEPFEGEVQIPRHAHGRARALLHAAHGAARVTHSQDVQIFPVSLASHLIVALAASTHSLGAPRSP